MASTLALATVGLGALYLVLWLLLHLTQDANEPPCLPTSLPFLGPILAMGRHKSRFHRYIRDRFGRSLPIYTIRLPGTRMYVVNNTALLPAVHRLYRTVSFAALEARAALTVMPLSKSALNVIQQGLTEDSSYTMSFASAIHPALAPGAHLDAMNSASIRSLAAAMDDLQAGPETTTAKLFEWARHVIVMATTDAVYGPYNPFRDPAIENAFYRFEPRITTFLLGLPPKVFANDAWHARQAIYEAFVTYFKAGHHEQGSALVQCRYQHSVRFGFSMEDIAACEIGGVFAILGSTAPSGFWLIYHLFSDPAVLADCRKEVQQLVQVQEPDVAAAQDQNAVKDNRTRQGKDKAVQCATIDITSVQSKCPILASTLQEVLRLHHIGVSARMVLQDEDILDGKYRLKKGGMVIIPTPVMHSEPSAWGPSASEFNHKRFVTGASGPQSSDSKHASPSKTAETAAGGLPKDRAAFRPWGGGHVLCPGRHFATTEILAFAALVLLRFDLTPANGQSWSDTPTIEKSSMATALPTPDDSIQVHIRAREPRYRWRVGVGDSDGLC